MRRVLLAAMFLLLSLPAYAQDKPTVPVPASAEYTDLDKAELQIVALQQTIRMLSDQLGECRTQLAPLVSQANAAALPKAQDEAIARIEARHPGFVVNRQTGLLEPKPAVAPKEK